MPAEPPRFDPAFQRALGDLFAWRRDVRRFKTDAVPEELLAALFEQASLAPSVGNSQPWRWVRVDEAARRAGIQASFESCNRTAADGYKDEARRHYLSLKLEGLRDAPVQCAVFCDEASVQGRGLGRQTMPEMLLYSTVISIHTFWLAARAHGVGVGWVSIIAPEDVKTLLEVPASWKLVGYLCVGWPQEEHQDPELGRAGWQSRQPLEILRR